MAIAGKIMPRTMGAYDASVVYGVLDIVTHAEKPWICRRPDTVGIEPTKDNADYWQLLIDVDITNADTLDGNDSTYFATQAAVDEIMDGTTPVGDSTKFNGNTPDYFVAKSEARSLVLVTFAAALWQGESAPYTQTVAVEGITEADSPIPLFVDDGTSETESNNKKKSYGYISYFDSEEGTITATCKYKKPTTDFSVGLKGV